MDIADTPAPSTPADMQYWQQRCSICFENQCDFCLDRCRDQFCRACFNRYVSEIVKSSWGIAKMKVKCPVCNEVLARAEWSRFVQRDVVDQFDKNNRPYKTIARACPDCSHEINLATVFDGNTRDRESLFEEINDLLTENYGNDQEFLLEYQSLYRRHLFGTEGSDNDVHVDDIYNFVVAKLLKSASTGTPQRSRSMSKRRRTDRLSGQNRSPSPVLVRSRISSMLVSLEARPDIWRELQFTHIANFPKTECEECHAKFCFQCGEASWHIGLTCHDYIAKMISDDKEVRQEPRLRIDTSPERLSPMECTFPTPLETATILNGWVKNTTGKWEISRQDPVPVPAVKHSSHIDPNALENLKWKLANTKPCPRCCIHIHREEGCNKVDCTMCGHRFCWICRGPWSDKCGFFKCRLEPATPMTTDDAPLSMLSSSPPTSISTEPEIGVPDVVRIHSRFASPTQESFPA